MIWDWLQSFSAMSSVHEKMKALSRRLPGWPESHLTELSEFSSGVSPGIWILVERNDL